MPRIDEQTKEIIHNYPVTYIYNFVNGQYVVGYTQNGYNFLSVDVCGKTFLVEPEFFEKHKFYSNLEGKYILDCTLSQYDKIKHTYTKGFGFPYSFPKKYEAIESFRIFKDRQQVISDIQFPLSDFLDYTFGLEFETSCGIVPEDLCFRDGLIPLRDGSINGNEYSTVVLKGNEGLNLLKQQIDTLKKYTDFDKECSLHIHMGGFPLTPEKIYSLYALCFILQQQLGKICPKYTFITSRYKASGKDYCKPLKRFDNFEQLYSFLSSGRHYFGNLSMPHPDDIERQRKWQIHQRYFWANFINLCFYDVNKTMEFRLLRPTYNFHKILVWLYIFNAILKYAENNNVSIKDSIQLQDIFRAVYPQQIAEMLDVEVLKLQYTIEVQSCRGDYIGELTNIENFVFEPDEII